MIKKQVLLILFTLIFAVALAGTASAANYTVGPNSSYNYNSISSAVSAAGNGDSITVYSNNSNPYIENVYIAHNLTIKANGSVTVRASNPGGNVFYITSGGNGTTIKGFTITGASSGSGVSVNTASNVKIINNTIINCLNGVSVDQSSNDEISGNTITYAGSGYSYGIYASGSSSKISENTITLAESGTGDTRGIHVWGPSFKISGNTIKLTNSGTGGSYGINLNSNSGNGHDNEISGNTVDSSAASGNSYSISFSNAFSNRAVGNNLLSGKIENGGNDNHLNFNSIGGTIYSYSSTFDALYNWYGSNANPSSKISTASGSVVNYNPWLVLTVNASPSIVNTVNSSIITADFTHDSNGVAHDSGLGHFPDGISVNFATDFGTINSESVTVNGVARAMLKSAKIGTANVSIKLNSQTMQTSVKIVDTIPPKITSTYPKNGAKGVSRTKIIKIKFSENIKSSVNWSKIYVKNKYGHKVKISKSITGNYLYIKTHKRASYSYYTVYIPVSAVKDYAGNKLAKYSTFKFKTGKY